MADPRFFRNAGIKTLGELAALTGAGLDDRSHESRTVADVAPLDTAGAADICFFDNPKYRESLAATKAGACILRPEAKSIAPSGAVLLFTPDPYKAYAKIAAVFYPEQRPPARIAPSAHIDPSATIGVNTIVEPGAVIEAGAVIGEDGWIGANAVIGANVVLGRSCRVGANAVISHSLIGDFVRIYPGCCIGQDGFGFAVDPKDGHVKVPQLGRVIIGDHVEIGANTAIDRGSGPDTVIGAGTWIDNLVQIAHNVKIGRGCMIAAQVGFAGSAVVEDFAAFGGQAGIAGHLRVGRGARIGAQSGVLRDVPPGAEMMGTAAIPLRQFMRQVAFLNRMTKKDEGSGSPK